MPRSGAEARERLRAAALELYRERGYDATTAAQIADRAGVTERTFFRHFDDKREVLFDGEEALRTTLTDAVIAAPGDATPLDVLRRAFAAAVPLFVAGRAVATERAPIIAATPALLERAAAKTASLVDALGSALTDRGLTEPTARMAAQVGMAAFERASSVWDGASGASLQRLIDAAFEEVRALG